jgi:O-antigen/teichoic acid export membrane protein
LTQSGLRANFAFNVTGMVLAIALALFTVPVYISFVGAARYGVLSLVWILLGYFGFLDFGLARASANALAKLAYGSEDRARVLMTSLYMNLVLGILGGFILYLVGSPILHQLMTLSGELGVEVENSLPWIAGMLPLALLDGVGTGALDSHERFFIGNVLRLVGVALGQILPLTCAVIIGPTLTVVIPAAFVARAISVALLLGFVAQIERPALFTFDRKRCKELLGFGAWVTITNIIGPLLVSIDRFLIAFTLGAKAVAYYSVPVNLTIWSQLIPQAMARTVFPRFSRLGSQEALELAERSTVFLAYGFGAICGPAIIVGGLFMTWWLGSEFASHTTQVVELLMVGAWINGIAFIPYSLLQGQGRPDMVAKLHALELLPYVIALWLLLNSFGLPGAALAWCGRVAIDAAIMFKLARLRSHQLLRLIPALGLVLVSYFIALSSSISPLYRIIFAGIVFFAFAGSAIALDATSRKLLQTLRQRLASATT